MPANAFHTMIVMVFRPDIFCGCFSTLCRFGAVFLLPRRIARENQATNGLASASQMAPLDCYGIDAPPSRTHAFALIVTHWCRRTNFHALMRSHSPRFIGMGSAESDIRVFAHAGLHSLFYRPGSLACFWTSLIPELMLLTRVMHTHVQTSSQWA